MQHRRPVQSFARPGELTYADPGFKVKLWKTLWPACG